MVRWCFAVTTVLAVTVSNSAYSDEIVRTTDGRSILLRSDGTYTDIKGLGPIALGIATAAARTYATDKSKILACLEHEPDGADKTRNYFAEDEQKTRSLWSTAGGSEEEWSEVESALKTQPEIAVSDCAAIVDGWVRLEQFSWPLSYRSPFKEMEQ